MAPSPCYVADDCFKNRGSSFLNVDLLFELCNVVLILDNDNFGFQFKN